MLMGEFRCSMNRTTTCSYVTGLHPDPPPCQKRHRGGDLEAAVRLRRGAARESTLSVILHHRTGTGPLLCAITRARRRVRVEGGRWR
jgi:hypothetical protein